MMQCSLRQSSRGVFRSNEQDLVSVVIGIHSLYLMCLRYSCWWSLPMLVAVSRVSPHYSCWCSLPLLVAVSRVSPHYSCSCSLSLLVAVSRVSPRYSCWCSLALKGQLLYGMESRKGESNLVNYQLLAVMLLQYPMGTPSCSRSQPATANGGREGIYPIDWLHSLRASCTCKSVQPLPGIDPSTLSMRSNHLANAATQSIKWGLSPASDCGQNKGPDWS